MATRTRRINTQQTTEDGIIIDEQLESVEQDSLEVILDKEDVQEIPMVLAPVEKPIGNLTLDILQDALLAPDEPIKEIDVQPVIIDTYVELMSPDATLPKLVKNGNYFDLMANFTNIPAVLIITKDNVRINKPVIITENNRQFRGVVLEGHERALIPTNLKFTMPENCKMNIYSKPGLSFNFGLTLCSGVDIINSSYRDALFISIHNTSNIRYTIRTGDKIAQAEIVPFFPVTLKLVS